MKSYHLVETFLFLFSFQLQLIHEDENSGVKRHYFSWQNKNNSTTWRNTSFYLCDGNSREVTVDRLGNVFRLLVDGRSVIVSSIPVVQEMNGVVYIAGLFV